MKRFLAMMLVVLMVVSLAGCASASTATEEAKTTELTTDAVGVSGIFEGTGQGKDGVIRVNLTLEKNVITGIEITESHETEGLSEAPMQEVINQVLAKNNLTIDEVSGASYSTNGLLEAIESALGAAGVTVADLVAVAAAEEDQTPLEYRVDVVVVGAGGAGMTAAITAKEAGTDVVVLEKMSFVGGNTLVSGGELNVPGSWVQENKGVEDSVEQYTADTLKGGDNQANPELVAVLAENALAGAEWLRDEIKVNYQSDYLMQFGGHSVPRAIFPEGGSGYEMISKLKVKADELGIPFHMNTRATRLLTDESGRVIGVEATKGDQTLTFLAENGVVLATGGFGSNVEMRMAYNAEYDERYNTTDQEGTTGDGIAMAEAVGADLVDMEFIQTYPACSTTTGILSYVADTRFDGALLFNKEGDRFVGELDRRDVISKGILAQTDSVGYLVWDNQVTEASHMENFQKEYDELVKNGELYKADSVEELANHFGLNLSVMQAVLDQYNEDIKTSGEDSVWNRRGLKFAIEEAPFYIQKVAPSVHHTMGGIVINTQAQVMTAEGQAVEGLYAAGEVTGGIHGKNRLGGNAITDLTVFGRIAGQEVAR
ncbi:urocanate reductase [Gottschalkiaceae bacterium SANA]|nr:urocanate reductase [Gottschalkiaceae bacterium SANA]